VTARTIGSGSGSGDILRCWIWQVRIFPNRDTYATTAGWRRLNWLDYWPHHWESGSSELGCREAGKLWPRDVGKSYTVFSSLQLHDQSKPDQLKHISFCASTSDRLFQEKNLLSTILYMLPGSFFFFGVRL
jgi:hypothetical protein